MDVGDFMKHFTNEVVGLLRDPVVLFNFQTDGRSNIGIPCFSSHVVKMLPTDEEALRQIEHILEWGVAQHNTLHVLERGTNLVVLSRTLDAVTDAEFLVEEGSRTYVWWHTVRQECLTKFYHREAALFDLKDKHVSHIRNLHV